MVKGNSKILNSAFDSKNHHNLTPIFNQLAKTEFLILLRSNYWLDCQIFMRKIYEKAYFN